MGGSGKRYSNNRILCENELNQIPYFIGFCWREIEILAKEPTIIELLS